MEKGTKVNKKISKTAKQIDKTNSYLKNDYNGHKEITAALLINHFAKLANPRKAKILSGFFKTGKGEYGEGDVFIGLTVPVLRNALKPYIDMPFDEIKKLLYSKVHEQRFAALQILVIRYKKSLKNADIKSQREIYKFYISHKEQVNNWDLVDSSAEHIVGDYLFEKDKNILVKFAKSQNLWVRRISMLSCFDFIKKNEFDFAVKIAQMHLQDKHDLMHKAVGWMLREIGKRDKKLLIDFLKKTITKCLGQCFAMQLKNFQKQREKNI